MKSIEFEAEFGNQIAQLQQALATIEQQKVALWLDDAAWFACALIACLHHNKTLLLPPNWLAENQDWVKAEQAFLLDAQTLAKITTSKEQTAQIDFSLDLNALFDRTSSQIWLKTSGSSGEAKIIQKTAQQMWAEAQALAEFFAQNLPDVREVQILGSVSVQHLYGLSFCVMLPLKMGWRLGREQLHYPEYLLAQSKGKAVIWVSSPALLSRLSLQHKDFAQIELKAIISSGGALPEQVAAQIRTALSCPLVEIYGSSETGVIASRLQLPLWQPLSPTQIALSEDGTLQTTSPWAGEQQTADAVTIETNGFQLLGRLDRIIKLGDKRLSLARLEQDLLLHPWVNDCYIALHPDYQRPLAWVALTETALQQPKKAIIEQLKKHLLQTQERLALPRYWRFCDKLPRNSQSKISRADFEQICRNQTATPLENELKTVAIIPHYNHSQTLPAVVKTLLAMNLPVLVVDDGSTLPEKAAIAPLEQLNGVQILWQTQNGGKGAAVKAGLNLAFEQGFSHAIQVDADGQHRLSDIQTMFKLSAQNPKALICGKPIYGEDAPKVRLYGRKITDFWNAVNTLSNDIKDGMCGFRLYPLAQIQPLLKEGNIGDRMDFDTEILVRSHWQQIPIYWFDTPVRYEQGGISHFRGFADNWLISKMHARLFFGMLKRLLQRKPI